MNFFVGFICVRKKYFIQIYMAAYILPDIQSQDIETKKQNPEKSLSGFIFSQGSTYPFFSYKNVCIDIKVMYFFTQSKFL